MNNKQRITSTLFLLISLLLMGCSPTIKPTQIQLEPSITPENTETNTQLPLVKPTISVSAEIRLTEWAKRKEIYSMAVSPNGQQLALSASYGMQVYNLADGALVYAFENKIPRFQGVYSQIAWSPNGNYLAIGTLNFGVRIWDTTSWDVLTQMGDEKAYTSAVWSHPGFVWSPDSKKLVLGIGTTGTTVEEYEPGRILIWNQMSNNWTVLKTSDDFVLHWHENGQVWVLGDGKIYDGFTGELIKEVDVPSDFVVLSPDQKHWYGHFDLGGDVFDLETQEYEFNVCCYAEFTWSPDGRYFASTPEGDNKITYWDTLEQKTIVFDEQGDIIYALAWTPSGELLAAGFRDGINCVWNTNSQKVLLEIE